MALGVRTLVVLLGTVYRVPMKKIRQLFHDVYGYEVNEESTIQSATQRCYTRLTQQARNRFEEKITQSVVAFDETGIRVAGKLRWLHTACTQLYTHLFTHDKRGKKALMDSASIMPALQYAMHDCLSSYFSFTQCSHAVCGAHLLRELTALEEQGRVWAGVFKKFLLDLYEQTQQGKGQLSESERQKPFSTLQPNMAAGRCRRTAT